MADSPVTQALMQRSRGDRDAVDRVLPLVYSELHRIAERALRSERPGHTLSATALVHETYLKLVQLDQVSWQGRAHFLGACAGEMRRVLISHARKRDAERRGGGAQPVTLTTGLGGSAPPGGDGAQMTSPAQLLDLDDALRRLEALNARQARVVECRFFAGMEVEETAEALGVSVATVKRDWAAARAWLHRELKT